MVPQDAKMPPRSAMSGSWMLRGSSLNKPGASRRYQGGTFYDETIHGWNHDARAPRSGVLCTLHNCRRAVYYFDPYRSARCLSRSSIPDPALPDPEFMSAPAGRAGAPKR